MKTSESITKIAPALVKAQAAMQAAAKAATNPHFKSKYADLATVIDAVKGPLIAQGIMFMQSPGNTPEGVSVTTRFQHESGEFIEDTIYLPVPQQTPQAYGSAITYGKRYGLQSMTGLPSEDDDGQAASESAKQSEPKAKQDVPGRTGANDEGKQMYEDLSAENKDYYRTHATNVEALFETGDHDGMVQYVRDEMRPSQEDLMILWHLLAKNSKLRSAYKAAAAKKPTPAEYASQA